MAEGQRDAHQVPAVYRLDGDAAGHGVPAVLGHPAGAHLVLCEHHSPRERGLQPPHRGRLVHLRRAGGHVLLHRHLSQLHNCCRDGGRGLHHGQPDHSTEVHAELVHHRHRGMPAHRRSLACVGQHAVVLVYQVQEGDQGRAGGEPGEAVPHPQACAARQASEAREAEPAHGAVPGRPVPHLAVDCNHQARHSAAVPGALLRVLLLLLLYRGLAHDAGADDDGEQDDLPMDCGGVWGRGVLVRHTVVRARGVLERRPRPDAEKP
mmetsp:Transcript_20765/g.70666  ORF Transcript_20765/g.70666 Transcript_20765/m.70666 type:complete len:264 (-) Transcript_20765:1288-2079(-)